MKNKVLTVTVFVFAALIGTAFLVGSAPKALAYDDYGYSDYGYGGYDDYGYDDYGYSDYCDYGCGDYGYDNYDYCDYGCGDSYDYCDYGCGDSYDYCDYGCDDYDYNPCDYGCGTQDCYDCQIPYDDCYYGYCGTPRPPYVPPVQPPVQPAPVIHNDNTNDNNNNNNNNNTSNNVNTNVNNNSIRINISNPVSETPVRREVAREVVRDVVRERQDDQLICTPASQSAGVNQTVNVNVSGGTGTYSWLTPEASNVNRRGSGLSLSYSVAGYKTITVTSGNQTATCSVQVTGGQVLAAFTELPNTGAGGINAQMGNIIAFVVSLVLGSFAVAFVTRRRNVIA